MKGVFLCLKNLEYLLEYVIYVKSLILQDYPIKVLCDFAGISRSSYYKWLNKEETKKDKENSIIIKELTKIYDDVNGIYGYRRMTMNINRNLNKQYNYYINKP